ncbi:hypothetical protein OO185_02500 [Prosthecochloris sp. SCSIO W1102]|uniref:hypothetical protein n=1 Tax=Prosthecochloris sp. SCSIO W1102 TaxID=2992243 RepID=UPI00223DAAA0|nr:hypothetical protein [Prosthecochloris sp. SCSIO W1102]UZJ39991.1 hypothetical protein OO185_02500 [Prosthecochloris sp. SCSIO W1102]
MKVNNGSRIIRPTFSNKMVRGSLYLLIGFLAFQIVSCAHTNEPRPSNAVLRERPIIVGSCIFIDDMLYRYNKATQGEIITGGNKSNIDSLLPPVLPHSRPSLLEPEERLFRASVGKILQHLVPATIAFNTPKQMNIKEQSDIQLLLGLDVSVDSLISIIDEDGEIESSRIKVSPITEARLTGANFSIEAVTPEQQIISSREVTEWKWVITPKKEGKNSLHLTLTAIITVNGEEKQRAIRTFEKTIFVNVTPGQKIADFVNNNGQWLWAVFVAPLLPLVWNRLKNKKNVQSN